MQVNDALSKAGALPRPAIEVADIFRQYGEEYRLSHPLSPFQRRVMRNIETCRTASLGGHVDVCEHGCGYQRISYNSCRNRHCPKCQGIQSARWLAKIQAKILPTHYFHVVFTVPQELHPIILQNRRVLYNRLFSAAAQSLLQFAKEWKRLRAEVGFTAILHTWNQEMLFHPHIHVVVTGGGLDPSQARWIPSRDDFLVPVRALSKKFAGKFLDFLKKAYTGNKLRFLDNIQDLQQPENFRRLMDKLYKKKWVLYSKQPFGGPNHVFEYLGLYTHKVAISSHRLVQLSDNRVTFLARDNQNPGRKRSVTISPHEFIRRFLLHILPKGFMKTRHYGLMAPGNVSTKLEIARKLIPPIQGDPPDTSSAPEDCSFETTETKAWVEIFREITGIDLQICPKCRGVLVRRPLTTLPRLPASFEYGPPFPDSS